MFQLCDQTSLSVCVSVQWLLLTTSVCFSAVEKLLGRSRQAADMKKEDGFTALHLACLNGHGQVVETLALQGQCDLDAVNNRHQTPLLLAVSQVRGHKSQATPQVSGTPQAIYQTVCHRGYHRKMSQLALVGRLR